VSPLENKGSGRVEKGPSKADLIEKLIGSETKAELLMFFHENPDSTDTVEGIANSDFSKKLGQYRSIKPEIRSCNERSRRD